MISIGKAVRVIAEGGAGYWNAEVVRVRDNIGEIDYLVEFEDGTRNWIEDGAIRRDIKQPYHVEGDPIFLHDGTFSKVQVVETMDWTNVKQDGRVVYDGDDLRDFTEVLTVLNVEHTYAYYDDIEDFRTVVGDESTVA